MCSVPGVNGIDTHFDELRKCYHTLKKKLKILAFTRVFIFRGRVSHELQGPQEPGDLRRVHHIQVHFPS